MPVFKVQRTPKGIEHRQKTMAHYSAAVESAPTEAWHRVVGSGAIAVREIAASMNEPVFHFYATLQRGPKAYGALKESDKP